MSNLKWGKDFFRLDHKSVQRALRACASAQKALVLARFFKTGPGQYGEGDRFLGVVVPDQRRVAKQFAEISLGDIDRLLESPWHEDRLTGLLILVDRHGRSGPIEQRRLHRFYLQRTASVNNWDLVDQSAYFLVGPHVDPNRPALLDRLARSANLWERRIAMVATFYFIRQGVSGPALRIADKLMDDRHDLIHKAVGWMLREVGKRCSIDVLRKYLDRRADRMPRTALRYAIERFSPADRAHYLSS